MATQTQEQLRAQLADQGWCVVHDVISRSTAAEAVARLWSAVERNAQEGYSCYLPEIDPNANNVRVLNPVSADPLFRELIEHPVALEIARMAVGHDLVLANCTANISRPGARSMALHSDLAFILPEPWLHSWSVNIIWCLTDVRPDNGATRYIPGSHHWRTHTDVPAEARELLVPFEAPAGSIMVMDGRLWHTSGDNITANEDRALLFGYYSAGFLRPMINWNAVLDADTQRLVSPRMRRLLGLDVFANTPDNENRSQGHFKGMPVGRAQALTDFDRVRPRPLAARVR